jgi:hypothetical protein
MRHTSSLSFRAQSCSILKASERVFQLSIFSAEGSLIFFLMSSVSCLSTRPASPPPPSIQLPSTFHPQNPTTVPSLEHAFRSGSRPSSMTSSNISAYQRVYFLSMKL